MARAMKIHFDVDSISEDIMLIDGVEFTGRTGQEETTNLKDAMKYLNIENPRRTVSSERRNIGTTLTSEEYHYLLRASRVLKTLLWRYPEDKIGGNTHGTMNAMVLLENAIKTIAENADYLYEVYCPDKR